MKKATKNNNNKNIYVVLEKKICFDSNTNCRFVFPSPPFQTKVDSMKIRPLKRIHRKK